MYTKEEILKRFNSNETKGIYGFMYGTPIISSIGVFGEFYKVDKIIKINKKQLQIIDNGFLFIWGMPGPDYNIYKFNDYMKTWCFADQDFITEEELEQRRKKYEMSL